MTRLSRQTLDQVPTAIPRPVRAPVATGIVHFGPGAFHRAHQADYVDRLLDADPRWGIAAVSMRTRGTVDALAAQDGLYTLAIRDAAPSMRIIAAHNRFLGPEDSAQTLALLADPAVGLVTTTVTEKGYCLAPDGTLDRNHEDVVHDLRGGAPPRSVVGWIVAGLGARRSAGLPPFIAMPCDNLAGNGAKLHAALVAYAQAVDPELARWIAGEVRVPSTMVDSITPASDEGLRASVAAALSVDDDCAVQREAFTQWVIEDIGQPLGPDLAAVGAIVTDDVAGFENAKLRILNGAHSTLAYAGLLRGRESVSEAMRDIPLAAFVDRMIREDILPMVPRVAGFDLDAYRVAVLERFRNPAIVHRLDQIAIDGSQKLPYRLGDTLMANRVAGRLPRCVVGAMGAWIAFLMHEVRAGRSIRDPHSDRISLIVAEDDAAMVARRLAEADIGIPRAILNDGELLEAIEQAAAAAWSGDWIGIFDA